MTLVPHWLVALVAAERVIELVIARRNTARLLASGGHEVGAGHYPLIVATHVAWLATLWLAVPPTAALAWPWAVVYILLAAGRVWVMTTLGPYWTTRIIQLPGAPLVRHGPYRYCRHPNYAVVAGEIAVLPLAFGRWDLAVTFSLLNAAVLAWRMHVENAALAARPSGSR
jgi:methyltransferase